MMLGITDEFGIGISYRTLDIIFHGLELGMDERQIMDMGPTLEQINLALELNRLSAWKRESPHAVPPVGSTQFDLYEETERDTTAGWNQSPQVSQSV